MTYEDSAIFKAAINAAKEEGRKVFPTLLKMAGYAHEAYPKNEEAVPAIEAAKEFLTVWDGLDDKAILKKVASEQPISEANMDYLRVLDEPEDVGYSQPRCWQMAFDVKNAINEGVLEGYKETLKDAKRILKDI